MAKKLVNNAVVVSTKDDDSAYYDLLKFVSAHFASATVTGACLFRTNANDLFDLYLSSLPKEIRQQHNCTSCRRFITEFGDIVVINEDGSLDPVMWGAYAPEPYGIPVFKLRLRVAASRVTGPFLSSKPTWGTPSNKSSKDGRVWSHIAVTPDPKNIFQERLLTAGQAMAASRENFATVSRALSEMPSAALDQAIRLFEGEHLDRAEHFVAPVRWLRSLQDLPKGCVGHNLLWRAIAAAPEGYCHPRSSVVWPLLEEILAGSSFETIKAKFEAMVDPLRYQRPQTAPSAATIKQAEEAFSKLGLAPALERRFALLSDIQVFLWKPSEDQPASPASQGVFGHLKARESKTSVPVIDLPARTVTWEKFSRDFLEGAEKIQLQVPSLGAFTAFTSCVHPDAPPLLKWDSNETRNQVAWYTYHSFTSARQWNLQPSTWADVTGVIPFPTMWANPAGSFLGKGYLLSLRDCRDTQKGNGNALFPECILSELHGMRSVIEAYSQRAELQGREEAEVCGIAVRDNSLDIILRVWRGGSHELFKIDRFS